MENHLQSSVAAKGRQTAALLYGAGAAAVGVGRLHTTTSMTETPAIFAAGKNRGFPFFYTRFRGLHQVFPQFLYDDGTPPQGAGFLPILWGLLYRFPSKSAESIL